MNTTEELHLKYKALEEHQQELLHKTAVYFALYTDTREEVQRVSLEISLLEEQLSTLEGQPFVQLELFEEQELITQFVMESTRLPFVVQLVK